MGEILEEGDKADGEKKESAEGEEGADKPISTEKKEGVTEEPAVVNKEVLVWNHGSCNLFFWKICFGLEATFTLEIPIEGLGAMKQPMYIKPYSGNVCILISLETESETIDKHMALIEWPHRILPA